MNITFESLKTAYILNAQEKQEISKRTMYFMALAMVAVLAFMPELALAEPWDGAANKVLAIFTGGLARTIAVIAVIACGIAALAGKLFLGLGDQDHHRPGADLRCCRHRGLHHFRSR